MRRRLPRGGRTADGRGGAYVLCEQMAIFRKRIRARWVMIGGDELNVITARGCSDDELRRPTHCKMITLLLFSSLSL
ncbi:hypothetical protein DY000_02060200 [Brassica cretica]|uniref:Uncharacterized protein n=1 Tax=Brassica cretica TaxID=69181 RepID=A0ABQ7ASR3_BRACR|nr:hypothetical protein DY000_02060200 [Brassica cretica]